uniref:Uncharacterized protein n=1 Tax=Anguilla anguilla TaxID=7936 RepID=A0A0E9UQX3_ANGAN
MQNAIDKSCVKLLWIRASAICL